MLHSDRIDICEGIEVNETGASEGCGLCHYWYFLNYSFKFQPMLVIDVMIYEWCLWTLATLLF